MASVTDSSSRGKARFGWLGQKLPAVCDVSVTNVCNAACDFCGFARQKNLVGPRSYLDASAFARALPILYRRGIRHMTLQGGEPLVHPDIVRLVSHASKASIQCGVITNGWFLPRYIEDLAKAGLARLVVSLDSASLDEHEQNRGLEGLEQRIVEGIEQAHDFGIAVQASVTVNRLVKYDELPATLRRLGFDAVSFSYPRRKPLGSTSLVYDEQSKLVDFNRDELLAALESIRALKRRFPVLNPAKSLDEVARFVRGEDQRIPCVGGYKYFYLDWNLDIWRCEAWHKPLGSVFDLEQIPDERAPCNACMMGCYRNASMFMHAGVAAADSLTALGRGEFGLAIGSLFQRSVAESLWSTLSEVPHIRRLTARRRLVSGTRSPDAQPTGEKRTS